MDIPQLNPPPQKSKSIEAVGVICALLFIATRLKDK